MQSFHSEIDKFLKSIIDARKSSKIDLLRINENTLVIVSLHSIRILTETQKEMIDLLVDSPRTGAQLAKLTKKTPQFISKIMKTLVKYKIVDHIPAPFGPSKFYTLTANIIGKEELNMVKDKAIPNELQTEIERRGV